MLCQSDLNSVVIAQGIVSKKTSRPFFLPAMVARRKEKQTTNIPIEKPGTTKYISFEKSICSIGKICCNFNNFTKKDKKPQFSQ